MNFYTASFKALNTPRGYLKLVGALLIAIFIPVIALNIIVDPLFLFEHSSTVPKVDFVNYERDIKIRYLLNHPHKFKAILIGSSRVTYIPMPPHNDYKIFNASTNGCGWQEYLPWLKLFEETQGTPELIIIGLDFFDTNIHNQGHRNLDSMIRWNRTKLPAVLGALKIKLAYKSLNLLLAPIRGHYYTRDLTHHPAPQTYDPKLWDKVMDWYVYQYQRYSYNTQLSRLYRAIVAKYPHSRIVVFFNPEYIDLQHKVSQLSLQESYKTWKQTVVEIFPEVYDFSGKNFITKDRRFYIDPSHYSPSVGERIMQTILRKTPVKGFGKVLKVPA